MGPALRSLPEEPFNPPAGVISMQVNPETGLRSKDDTGISEYFYQEYPAPDQSADSALAGEKVPDEVRNQLF